MTITYSAYGENYTLDVKRSYYTNNGNLAIMLTDAITQEPFGTLTVNLVPLPNGVACVDVNNLPGIENVLKSMPGVKYTNRKIHSGFVEYPVYEFPINEIPSVA